MVKRQLLQPPSTQAVDTTVTHVGHQSSLGQQQERAARGPHVAELGIGLPALVDLGVRLAQGGQDRFGWGDLLVFVVQMRYRIGGHLAGQLTRGVGAHAIRDDKDMPPLVP